MQKVVLFGLKGALNKQWDKTIMGKKWKRSLLLKKREKNTVKEENVEIEVKVEEKKEVKVEVETESKAKVKQEHKFFKKSSSKAELEKVAKKLKIKLPPLATKSTIIDILEKWEKENYENKK